MQILGCSTDSVEANAKFAEEQGFGYPLLCDTERVVCMAYGPCSSVSDGAAKRMTFVIGADGKVAQAHAEVNASEHPEALLASLK